MPPRAEQDNSGNTFTAVDVSEEFLQCAAGGKAAVGGSSHSPPRSTMAESFEVTMEKEHICEPGPLGLAGFAFTVFVLSAHNAGWAPDVIWVGPALFYGGLVLLLAGMWEFKKNNVFGATGFSTFGGFWMGLGFFVLLKLAGVVPETLDVSEAFGWFLTALFVFNTYMTITSILLPTAIFVAFALTETTLILLMIGSFQHNATWIKCGGYVGIATSASAWYASFAMVFNITAKKMVFPLGHPLLQFDPAAASLKSLART